ncbi:hypothetical protein ACVTMO_13685 [Pseudomonas segetis]
MAIKAWLGKQKDQILVGLIVALVAALILSVLTFIYSWATSADTWSLLKSDILLPTWCLVLILSALFSTAFLLRRSIRLQSAADARVATLQVEIGELRNPTLLSLDENDVGLIYAVAALYDIGREMTATQIAAAHDVPSVKIQAIADKLKRAGLLLRRRTLESPLKLTEKGRSYLDQPDVFDGYRAYREDFMK